MYRDHCIIYCSKVMYNSVSPFGLATGRIVVLRGDWQGIKRPCFKNFVYEGLQTCFCFQLYGVLSLVRVSGFWLKANFYMLGVYSLPRGFIVPNFRVYCVKNMAGNRPLVFQLICLRVKKRRSSGCPNFNMAPRETRRSLPSGWVGHSGAIKGM